MRKAIYAAVFVTVFLLVAAIVISRTPQEIQKRISVRELINMNSQQLIDILKQNRLTFITSAEEDQIDERYRIIESHYIKNWPHKSDIPSLLRLVDSSDVCGALYNPASAFWPKIGETNKTVGDLALILLKSIKEQRFNIHINIERPVDEEEIIAWAKKEITKL